MKEIIIFDETFCVNKKRVLAICDNIRKRRMRFGWDIRTRVDLLDAEILKSVKSAGCSRVHLGIESGNQAILDKMQKGITIPDIVDKVNLAKGAGLDVRGYFMLAYPSETRESMIETIKFAKSLPLDWASFTVTIGLPETKIYKQALTDKRFELDYWREYTKGNTLKAKPYFIPDGLDEKDVFDMKRHAYMQFYSRPRSFFSLLKGIATNAITGNLNLFFRTLPSIYSSAVERFES